MNDNTTSNIKISELDTTKNVFRFYLILAVILLVVSFYYIVSKKYFFIQLLVFWPDYSVLLLL